MITTTKSIHIHIATLINYQEALTHITQVHIYAYQARVNDVEPYSGPYMNIYGHLWTLTWICAGWTNSLIFPCDFSFLLSSQRHYKIPTYWSYMVDFYHHHSIIYDNNPIYSPEFLLYLLLFVRTFPLSLHVWIKYILRYNMHWFGFYFPLVNYL